MLGFVYQCWVSFLNPTYKICDRTNSPKIDDDKNKIDAKDEKGKYIYLRSVNSIEKQTNLDFFSYINAEIQEKIEDNEQYKKAKDFPDAKNILKNVSLLATNTWNNQEAVYLHSSASDIISSNTTIRHDSVTKDSSFEIAKVNYSQESGFSQIGIIKQTPLQNSTGKISSSQVGLLEITLLQLGISEISTNSGNIVETNLASFSTSQIGTIEVGSTKVSRFDLNTSQIGSTQVSSTQVSINQFGSFKNSPSEVGTDKTASSQYGSTKVGSTQIDSTEQSVVPLSQLNPTKVSLPSSIPSQQFFNTNVSHENTFNLLTNIYSTAQTIWHTATPINLNFQITNLPTGQLAEAQINEFGANGTPTAATILIDNDANGKGWFIDTTPWDSVEFNTTLSDTAYGAQVDSVAFGRYDLLTAIMHEMGHALGIINGYNEFDRYVRNRQFTAEGINATLTRDGSHLDSAQNPYSLMNSSLKPGERKLPSALELQILNAIRSTNADRLAQTNNLQAPLTSTALVGILNGTFDTPDDWLTRGNSTVTNGRAIIAEDPRYNSNFKQTFTVPNGAKYLQFTLLDTNLGNNLLSPGDAFEVALLDSHTHTSLVNTATGLTQTDALLNIQHDGRMYLSSNIIPTGYGSLHSPQTFTVDISHITPGTEATLYFDLLGFGNRDASVIFDNIRLISDLNNPPIAQDDTFSTNQNAPVTINPLNNDTDPDGAINPGSFTLNTNPTYGTLTLNDDGTLRYTPNPAFVGTDTFTYTVTGNNGDISNPATVTITVNNAAPSIDDIIVQSQVKEGTDATFQAIATDSGNLTYTWNFGDGTEAITGEKVTHKFANNGEYTGILTVTDELGAATQRQFTVKVDNVAPEIVSMLGFLSSTQPTPDNSHNLQLQTGETATFTGAATDIGGDTLTYTWNFGDDTETMTGNTVERTFTQPGTYIATLTVTDGDGGVSKERADKSDRLSDRAVLGCAGA